MRTVLLWLAALMTFAVIGAVGLLFYHGALLKVSVSEDEFGPFQFVFQPVIAANPQSADRISREIDEMLAGIGVEATRPMSIHYRDGSAQIGLVVEDVYLNLRLSNGTTVRDIDQVRYAVTAFPWKSPLSPVVGRYKAEPALEAYREAKGYNQSELMTLLAGENILFMQPIMP